MSGKSLDSFLIQTFSRTIRQNINILINNFPKTEEDQINLTKPILNYLVDFNMIIDDMISKCCILASVNLRNFFLEILEYFNQIPLDMTKTKFIPPLFFNDEMREKSITSYPLRLCTYYVSHSILTQVIYHIVLRTDFLKDEDYPLIYSAINQILFHEINEINSFKLDLINVSKWSIILHKMSKIIPDIIISDAFNHIQSSQLLHSYYHIFVLRLYSFLYYPKHILNNFPLISVTFQHLMSILNSNKVSNQLLIAGNKFIRNFLGYTIQYEQTPELNSLFKEINRILIKIQNEQCSWNSTLVLFNTLSNDKLSFFPLHKFFSLINRQFPTNSFKITDIIKTFIAILNGHFYMNLFTIEKIDINFFKSAPNRKDKGYLQKMLDIIFSNSTQFKHCQKELGLLLSKIASFNFAWFIRKQLNNLINKDFFQFNSEAVLYCATIIFSNESIILQNSKISSSNDPIVIQFKKSIIELCQKVMDDHPIDLFTTKCWIFDTNDFTSSLSNSSLSYEIEQILGNTSLVPLINEEDQKDVSIYIFNEINKKINEDKDINFDSYLNSVDEGSLRFYQMNPINHSSIENALLLCLLLAHEIEKSSPHLFNRIPMYLFSNSPFVSALTIRIIQAFIHVKHDQSILNSLLTLQTFEYEQLYIYGLALVRTAKSMVNCKIGLTVNSSNNLLSWQWILLSAPFSIIRELGMKLGEIIVPLLPYENFPNVHKFIVKHETEIFEKSMTILSLTFTKENEIFNRFKFAKFSEVMHSNSYLLYLSFFTNALKIFTMNEDKCPQLNHTMNITHAQAISLINAKKNIVNQVNYYFILNLISLRLATSSVFDKYTSPEQIFSLLKHGESILNTMKCNKRIYYFFFFSVNPCLELHFNCHFSSIIVDLVSFHFRIFMIEHFKIQKNDTNIFNATDLLSIKNYKNITTEVDYYSDFDDDDKNNNEKNLNDIESIEKVLCNVINFFDKSRMITKGKIESIDSDRMVIFGNEIIPKSINNLLIGLSILFEKLREKFVIENDSFFLNLKNYKKNNEIELQPFDPNLWFPFLYNIAIDSNDNFPDTIEIACNTLSIYASFVQIPEEFIIKIIKKQEKKIKNEFKKFWYLILIQYPKLLLPLFCDSVVTNECHNLTLFNCFRRPINKGKKSCVFNDLLLIKEFIKNNNNYSLNNEFDKTVIENIGNLISLSLFNLTLMNKNVSLFNILYNISLFAIVSNLNQSEKLIPILDQIMNNYSSDNFNVLIHPLMNLSSVLSVSFKPFTEQFLNNFFKIVYLNKNSSKSDMFLFIQFSIPWFSNIKLCNSETIGIVENCKPYFFTSYSFLNQLFALNFKQNEIEINFGKLPNFGQSILIIITKNNLKFVVDFVLRENVKNAESILIFLLSKNSKQLIRYLADHLHFEFSYFMEIQNNQRQLYKSIVNKILDVFIWILTKNYELISPYFHLLFVYCFVRQSHKPSNKKIAILKEISKILNKKNFIDCLKDLNNDDVVHEIFQWMVSFDDLNESMFAVELFQYITENKMVTSPSTLNYIIDITTNIKIVCTLLNQFWGKISSVYFEYVSKLMKILCSLDSPPVEMAIDLLRCNSEQFSPLFTTSLEIVSSNASRLKNQAKRIFLNLITADLNDSIIESIFGLTLEMINHNMFDLKNDPDVFFFMIPYFQVRKSSIVHDELNDSKIDFLSEIFGHEKSDLIINSFKEAVSSEKTVSSFFNEEFDHFVLKMVNQISGDIQFLIFSFFMKVVDICEYKYFYSIYMISLVLLKNKDKHSSLCRSVFSPLSKFFISHQNDKEKLNELIEFIQLFEESDSNILPIKKRNQTFPLIFDDEMKFNFTFLNSYPVVLTDFKSIDSNFVDELDSFVLSVQNMNLINQEKSYNLLKMQKIEEKNSVLFDFDLKNGIEKVNKLLNANDKKKTNLIPSNVPKIINVDRSVFRIVGKIDELID